MTRHVLINGIFRYAENGTGAWTRALIGAIPGAEVWSSTIDPTTFTARAHYRKMAAEWAMRFHRADLRLHPYWGVPDDPHAILCILDTIGFASAPRLQQAVRMRSAKRAAAVCAISQSVCDQMEEDLQRTVFRTTPHPDSVFFAPVEPQQRGDRLRVGYWGGYHPRKAVSVALRGILAGLQDVDLICVGTPDPALMDLGNAIQWCQPRTSQELVRLIDSFDVALYPSRDEGYGLPVHESLLRGVPIILRKLPSYADILTDDNGVYYLPDDSPEAICELVMAAARGGRGENIRRSLHHSTLASARANLTDQMQHIFDSLAG